MKYNVPQHWRELCDDAPMRSIYELREEVNKLRGVIKYAKDIWPAADWQELNNALGEMMC